MNNSISNTSFKKELIGLSNRANESRSTQAFDIEMGEGEQKANIVEPFNTSNKSLILYTMDISLDPVNNPDQGLIVYPNGDTKELSESQVTMVYFVYYQMKHLIEFIKKHINSNFEVKWGTVTFRVLLRKLGKLHAVATSHSPQITKLHQELMLKEVGPALDWMCKTNVEKFGGLDAARNTTFTLSVFREIFTKYYEFIDERNEVLALSLNSFDSEVVAKEFDLLINKAVGVLRELIDNKYYSILRDLLDLNVSVYEKSKILLQYIGLRSDVQCDKMSSEELYNEFTSNDVFQHITNGSCYLAKLQIFIDLLSRIQKSPKTLQNLKVALARCENCVKYFEEDALFYKNWCIKNNRNFDIPLNQNYNSIKNYLKKLCDELSRLEVLAMQSKVLESWSTPSASSKKKNQKQPQNKQKKLGNNQSKREKVAGIQNEKKQESGHPVSTEAQKVEGSKVNTTTSGERAAGEKEAAEAAGKTNDIVRSINSDEDSLESIERETSEIFEIIRQLIEKDRKAKLELKAKLKELKAMKKKQPDETEETPVIKEKKAEIVKLGADHRSTLDSLFQAKPAHLVISGEDVECLITQLGGKVQKDGNGSIKIFWGNSKKKAGEYEVAHGKDRKGTLTSEYAARVAAAIRTGVYYGLIAEETIYGEKVSDGGSKI